MSKDTNKDPKFHTDQLVWFMHKNKPIQLKVDKITISSSRVVFGKDSIHPQIITYSFIEQRKYNPDEHKWIEDINEECIFASKEELIASL